MTETIDTVALIYQMYRASLRELQEAARARLETYRALVRAGDTAAADAVYFAAPVPKPPTRWVLGKHTLDELRAAGRRELDRDPETGGFTLFGLPVERKREGSPELLP